MYLSGKNTFNFLHGPMFYGQGKMLEGNRDFSKICLNLEGPSESLWNTDFMCTSVKGFKSRTNAFGLVFEAVCLLLLLQ